MWRGAPSDYLEDEFVGLAEFGEVLVKLLVLLDLVVVGGVEEQLFDVSGLQAVGGQGHQHLPQLSWRQLQMGDQDGWGQRRVWRTPFIAVQSIGLK